MTRADNVLTTYTYDALNRLVSSDTGTQVRHATYDNCTNGIGRLCSVNDSVGTTAYAYTPEGQVTQRTFTMGATTYALGYSYDDSGRIEAITYPDGNKATYQYQYGRPSGVAATVGGATKSVASAVTYRPGDRLLTSWTAGNGLVNTYSYDGDGRLTGIQVPGLQSLTFTYDDADRITHITNGMDSALTQGFGYDALSRLTSVTSASGNQSYQYDSNGNRITQVVGGTTTNSVVDASSNRLLSVGGQAIGYDANGNTVSKGGVTQYHYDAFNRLASAGGMAYYINPEGQRLRKAGSLGTTYFAPDRSGPLLAEHPDSGWIDYVWLGSRLIGRLAGGEVDAVHTDQVGRPEAVTDASKVIVWRAQNFAFGRIVSMANITLNIGFPGQYYDAETGIWHNGFRDYDASLGRYIESDPIGLGGGLNTYNYVGGNPLNHTDSQGLKCVPGIGCWSTPDEIQLANGGNFDGYYKLACSNGDEYACFARHIEADNTALAHAANKWLNRALKKYAQDNHVCLDEDGIQSQIKKDLAKAYANYLPNSQGQARWPSANGVAQFHWAEFAKFGLPPSAFGGSPAGKWVLFFPDIWCPNCTW